MPTAGQMWVAAGALALTHQVEEAVFSIESWLDSIETTGWPRLDRFIRRNPLASRSARSRLTVVGAQAVGFCLAAGLASRSVRLSRALTTGVVAGFAAAFAGHITLAASTRSAMPGLATSIVPGLPGAALVLAYIHSGDRGVTGGRGSRSAHRRSSPGNPPHRQPPALP